MNRQIFTLHDVIAIVETAVAASEGRKAPSDPFCAAFYAEVRGDGLGFEPNASRVLRMVRRSLAGFARPTNEFRECFKAASVTWSRLHEAIIEANRVSIDDDALQRKAHELVESALNLYNNAFEVLRAYAEKRSESGEPGWSDVASDTCARHTMEEIQDQETFRFGMPPYLLLRFVAAAASLASDFVEVQTIVCAASGSGDYDVEASYFAVTETEAHKLARELARGETKPVEETHRMFMLPVTGVTYYFNGHNVEAA